MTDDRKCDSPKGGVKCIREVSQLTERCDGYEGSVRRFGRCDSCLEVRQEVCQLVGRCDGHGEK